MGNFFTKQHLSQIYLFTSFGQMLHDITILFTFQTFYPKIWKNIATIFGQKWVSFTRGLLNELFPLSALSPKIIGQSNQHTNI